MYAYTKRLCIWGEWRGQVQRINVLSWQHIRLVVSFPGLLHFCSLVCAQYNTRKRKSGEKGGRPQ